MNDQYFSQMSHGSEKSTGLAMLLAVLEKIFSE